ncbi:MAG: hypothetical protein JWQ01_4691 [Massilia sp.]|nr:hypothetical protein [Massilia sp.]
MNTCIYDKTDKGREEIATRKYQVPARLRTLLVLIDGRHSVEALLKNLAVLGVSAENVDELLRQEFIVLVGGGPVASAPEPDASAAARQPASARARMLARTREQAARKRLAADAGVPALAE